MYLVFLFLGLVVVEGASAAVQNEVGAPDDVNSDEALSEAFAVFGRARKEVANPHRKKHHPQDKRNFLHGSLPPVPPMPSETLQNTGAATALEAAAADAASLTGKSTAVEPSRKKHSSHSRKATHKVMESTAPVPGEVPESRQHFADDFKFENPFDNTPASFDIIHRAVAKHSSTESDHPQATKIEASPKADLEKHLQDRKMYEAWANNFHASSAAASFHHFAVDSSKDRSGTSGAAAALASAASAASAAARNGAAPHEEQKPWWEVAKEELLPEMPHKDENEAPRLVPHSRQSPKKGTHMVHKAAKKVKEGLTSQAKVEDEHTAATQRPERSPGATTQPDTGSQEGADDPLSRLGDAFDAFSNPAPKKPPAPVLHSKASSPLSRLTDAVDADEADQKEDHSASTEAIEAVREAKQFEDAKTLQRSAPATATTTTTVTTVAATTAAPVAVREQGAEDVAASSPNPTQLSNLTTYLKSSEMPTEVTTGSNGTDTQDDDALNKLNDVFGGFAAQKDVQSTSQDVQSASKELATARQQLSKATADENAAMVAGENLEEKQAAQQIVEKLHASTSKLLSKPPPEKRTIEAPANEEGDSSEDHLTAYLKSRLVPSVASEASTLHAIAPEVSPAVPAMPASMTVDAAPPVELSPVAVPISRQVPAFDSPHAGIADVPAVTGSISDDAINKWWEETQRAGTHARILAAPTQPPSPDIAPDSRARIVTTPTQPPSTDVAPDIRAMFSNVADPAVTAGGTQSSDISEPVVNKATSVVEPLPAHNAISASPRTDDESTLLKAALARRAAADAGAEEKTLQAPADTKVPTDSEEAGSAESMNAAAVDQQLHDAVGGAQDVSSVSDDAIEKLWESTRQTFQGLRARRSAGVSSSSKSLEVPRARKVQVVSEEQPEMPEPRPAQVVVAPPPPVARTLVSHSSSHSASGKEQPTVSSSPAVKDASARVAASQKALPADEAKALEEALNRRKAAETFDTPKAAENSAIAPTEETAADATPEDSAVLSGLGDAFGAYGDSATKNAESKPHQKASASAQATLPSHKAVKKESPPAQAALPSDETADATPEDSAVLSGLGDAFGAYGDGGTTSKVDKPHEKESPPAQDTVLSHKVEKKQSPLARAALPSDEAAALDEALQRRKEAETYVDNDEPKKLAAKVFLTTAEPAVAAQSSDAKPIATAEVEPAASLEDMQPISSEGTKDPDDAFAGLDSAFGAYSASKPSKAVTPASPTAAPTLPADESAALEEGLRRRQLAVQGGFDSVMTAPISEASSPPKSSGSGSQEFDLSPAFQSPQSPSQTSTATKEVMETESQEDESKALQEGLKRRQQAADADDTAGEDSTEGGWVRESSGDDGWQAMHEVLKRNHQLRDGSKAPAPAPRLPTHHHALPSWAVGDDSPSRSEIEATRTSSSSAGSDETPLSSSGFVGDLLGGSSEPSPGPQDGDILGLGSFHLSSPSKAMDALSAVANAAKSYQHTAQTALVPVDQTIHYGAEYVDTGMVDDFKSRLGGDDW